MFVIFLNGLNGLRSDITAFALGQMDNIDIDAYQKIEIVEADRKLYKQTLTLGKNWLSRLS
jgi:hypothetical protein